MICCDSCEEWFHGDCIGITMAKGREMEKTGEEWCCNACKGKDISNICLFLITFPRILCPVVPNNKQSLL